jgi:hypothetical protein
MSCLTQFKSLIIAQWFEFCFGGQKLRSEGFSWKVVLSLVHEQWYLAYTTAYEVMNIFSRLVLVEGLMQKQERMINEAKIMRVIYHLGLC